MHYDIQFHSVHHHLVKFVLILFSELETSFSTIRETIKSSQFAET